MWRWVIRLSVLICCLAPVPAGAVDPPEKDVELPLHVRAAQIEVSRSYGESGIARRLQEIKLEKEEASKKGIEYSATPASWNMPVIMGSYSDNAHIFTSAQYQTQLFGGNPTGSMTDYYTEVSYGQFSLSGTVYGPFTAAQTQAYYVNGDNGFGSDFPTNACGFIFSILSSGDASIDFSQYDNDGPDGFPNSGDDDGFVDVLTVVFPDGSASGGDSDNLWAHRWNLQYGAGAPYSTNDARSGGGFIQIDVYTVQGAELGDGTWNTIEGIGVYCHEFGHVLGLPDFYDTDSPRDSYGIGTYCLMSSGSWGANWSYNTRHRPTHMSAWCKAELGWLTPTVIVGTQAVEFPPVETNPVVYKLWDDAYQGGRCFLLENRTKTGFDADFYGQGVLIWHCNDEVRWDNSVNDFRVVDLEEADGLNHLDNMVNWMDAGDFYPGTTNKTTFNGSSNPNSNDVFGNSTGVSAVNFAYGSGLSVMATLTQRILQGYTIAYDNYAYMGGYGYSSPEVSYGAVRFTAPTDGQLVAVQAGGWESNPVGYTVRIFDDMVAGSPSGLNSTTAGSFPSLPVNSYYEIALSSSKTLSSGQVFLVDVGFGPDVWAVPTSIKTPISTNSYFSQYGTSYDQLTDRDCLIRARIASSIDSDGDGVIDASDNCPSIANPQQEDADGDNSGDVCDLCTDIDQDGYGNPGYAANTCTLDNCPSVANSEQTDADGDDIGDACDLCTDTDNDGFGNPGYAANTCPLDNCPAVSNPEQADADGDGAGDVCDDCTDTDNDGYGDPGYPATYSCNIDNCPLVANPGQEDINGDGIGDACCCAGRVGDANGTGTFPNEVTIGDISTIIDAKFITGTCVGKIACLTEADANQSGGVDPDCSAITISDVSVLVNHLFIMGPANAPLNDCL